MPRAVQPDETLAAVFPRVAATWHPTANLPLAPETVASKASVRARWRCGAGHEWDEVVATRMAMPAWKKGDVAACRVCVGYHSIVTFDCGHTAEVKTDFSDPARGCPDCRAAAYGRRQAEWAAGQAAARGTYAEDRARARELLKSIDVSAIPEPLLVDWRTQALKDLASAVSKERHHGQDGLTEATLARIAFTTRLLLPDRDKLESAVQLRQPVRLAGRAHWPRGWQHYLTYTAAHPPADPAAVADLRTALEAAVAAVVADGQAGRHDVATWTRWLTETVAEWGPMGRSWTGRAGGICSVSCPCR